MSEPLEEPPWKSLPHDPVHFFRLDGSFDRKDLKRAYNRLLRRFKPERFPAEFQRIRAAYEELDEQIRYHGGSARQPIRASQERPADDAWTVRAASTAKSAKKSLAERLVGRLATESPQLLFRELSRKKEKTPFDYYALSILSDIVEKSTTGFATWIVKGINAHPHDGALRRLLHEFLRGPQTPNVLSKILPAVAKAIGTDDFYPLTEPAWFVLLKDGSFSSFEATFAACESQLRDSHIVGRMTFLIQILKSAMWRDGGKGGSGWSTRQFDFVEENFESVPPWLEWDVDLLGIVREYLDVREEFVAGSPLRLRMDAALKDYFSEPQEVGDHSMVACQMEILSRGDALLEAFPMENGALFSQFYPIWAWATNDVAERQSIEQETKTNETIWTSRAEALLLRAERACNNSTTGVVWSAAFVGRMFAWLIVFLVLVIAGHAILGTALNFFLDSTSPSRIFTFRWLVLAGFGTWKLCRVFEEKLWEPLNLKFATKCYDDLWRQEVLEFQERSHVPQQFFRDMFEHFSTKNSISSWVNHFVQKDYAPSLLAGAQRFEA